MKIGKKLLTRILGVSLSLVLMIMSLIPSVVSAGPGEDDENLGQYPGPLLGSIVPQVTETGKISLSIDGSGTNDTSAIIQVEKPAGATVRSAFMAVATVGSYKLTAGAVKIDGSNYVWSIETPSSISFWNYWGDVTSIVKPTIDAAVAGRVDFTITETSPGSVDGEVLAVIFDDPNQTVTNTIILLFGAQNISGDTFNIGLGTALDKTDPNLKLDLSLGISFSNQTDSSQYSTVDVNGTRMSSWAGGNDDGVGVMNNGQLITVGGLDDTNANPLDPNAKPVGNPRYDDELYNILPFVNTGDTSIAVYTQNPSNDDNIFFAGLFLGSAIAIVGEGIVLGPATAINDVGTQHTVTATVQDATGAPIVERDVTFDIISGPHSPRTQTAATNASGQATFTYTGTSTGTDVIVASFIDSKQQKQTSAEVTKEWKTGSTTPPTTPPVEVGGDIYPVNRMALLTPLIVLSIILAAGAAILIWRRRTQS